MIYPPVELTIVVPTLNEAATLPLLLADLAAQQGVRFELIISDGGSADETPAIAEQWRADERLSLGLVTGPAGRPEQLDRGAGHARGEWLLLLHADARLPDPQAMGEALQLLRRATKTSGTAGVAGRFRLCFADDGGLTNGQKRLLEQKARLNRPGCIHGDQGLLLATARYRELAPLPDNPPMLAETWLADRLLATGEMLLFPHDIFTSARRFCSEGFTARQTLNALIMNFAAVGWPAFFSGALPLYRPQHEAGAPLILPQVLRQLHALLQTEPSCERRRIWRATGAYVAANAWQLALHRDVRRAAPDEAPRLTSLARFDRWLAPLVNSPAGRLTAMVLTCCWFQYQRRSST